MDNNNIKCTDGDWKSIEGLEVIVGAENINIANFKVHEIPEEERKGNILLCTASKRMYSAISTVSKLVKHYVQDTNSKTVLSEFDRTKLFVSRLEFILVQLQYRLPKQLQNGYKTQKELSTSFLELFKVSFETLPKAQQAEAKQEIIEYLTKQGC